MQGKGKNSVATPVIFAQIERSRQNGTFNIVKNIYANKNPITQRDFLDIKDIEEQDYFKKFKTPNDLTLEQYKTRNRYIFLKNKVELNNVRRLGELVIDLYIPLVGWCCIWERDLEYVLLALFAITGKPLKDVKDCFIYGEGKIRTMTGKVENLLSNNTIIEKLLNKYFLCKGKEFKEQKNYRNDIDHWNYFRESSKEKLPYKSKEVYKNKSLIEWYGIFYRIMHYDPKIRNNVYPKMLKVLERYHMVEGECEDSNKKKYTKKLIQFSENTADNAKVVYDIQLSKDSIVPQKVAVKLQGKLTTEKVNLEDENLTKLIYDLLTYVND